MRKTHGILNPQLSRVVSETGHTDTLVVTDAGLPIPPAVERVDLAYFPSEPPFLAVLDAVLAEVVIEGATLAEEIREASPAMLSRILERLNAAGVVPDFVPHTEFKARTASARAAVRSGEFTPYANIILHAGVAYGPDET
ncbi:D-ribose pyranase [Arthrobacter sp. Soil763]|uniref:D-ribose pyranase n=1 Tax=unclassified Arthrobacter TaxID=235627 RepID=UPI0007019DFB|nr:D-ribose pyranase [Arthrobacter sp. Soil763]KRE81791.1 ribose pyranase [Arthrobacter sp. Soil763]